MSSSCPCFSRARLGLFPILALAFLAGAPVHAQSDSEPDSERRKNETISLSPFSVMAEQDTGYAASSTLAGSRMNTPLADTSAPISVLTKDFLQDVGVVNLTEALDYVLNGSREFTTLSGDSGILSNDVNIQVRGFIGTTLTRNYFPWAISGDAFNMERIDVSRGPNAILYGIGAPGGVIDTTSKRALFGKKIDEVGVRYGSWDDTRATFDLNREVNKKLALRLNGVWQDKNSWRDYETSERTGLALAATYRPFRQTEIRLDSEYGNVSSVTISPWTFGDGVSTWLAAGKPVSANDTTAVPGTFALASGSRSVVYDPDSNTGPLVWIGARATSPGPAVPSSTLQSRLFSDESILPASANLWGPGQTLDFHYYNASLFVEQRFGNFTMELAYNKQDEKRFSNTSFVFNTTNLMGDANAIYPNNTLPNGQMPTAAGQPNPNVGKFYIQGNPQAREYRRTNDSYRLTLAYELNLADRHAWLGNHRFAALATRTKSYFNADALAMVNLNLPGTTNYPVDITNQNNLIYIRTYLDLASSDAALRSAHNPFTIAINNQNGITSGFRRVANATQPNLTEGNAGLVAGQSSWWKNRLVVTYGVRRDDQISYTAGTGVVRDPVTKEYLPRGLVDTPAGKSIGNTRTYGAVVHALPWLAAYYNNADTFVPQTTIDYDGMAVGGRAGKGEDYGMRFTPWNGRVNLSVGRYTTVDSNRAINTTNDASLIASINNLWNGLNQPGRTIGSGYRDAADSAAKGWEVQLVTNLTQHWKLLGNFSEGELQQTNTYRRAGAYIESHRAEWQQAAATNANMAMFLASVDSTFAAIQASDGTVPRQFVKYSASGFTSYTFSDGPNWLHGLTVGVGGTYRGRPVTGYSASHGGTPIYGNDYFLTNLMVSRTFKLGAGHSLGVQLNVNNVFDETAHILVDTDDTGINFYRYQTPLNWSLSAKLDF